MSASVQTPADDSAKSLSSLTATLALGDLVCYREVYPVGNASINEIVAAMQEEDSDFRNPLVEKGDLTVMHDGKCILLARYATSGYDGDFESAEIIEVSADFDDDTTETIVL